MGLPTALTYLYTSQAEIEDLVSTDGVTLRLDDDQDDSVSVAELLRLSANAVNYATGRVNKFLLARYSAQRLADSWQVHEWATYIAAGWLCMRRLNAVPKVLMEAIADAQNEMQEIHDHKGELAEIAERESDQPVLSNVTLDGRRSVKQIRVQRPISTRRPSGIPQTVDVRADIIASFEEYP